MVLNTFKVALLAVLLLVNTALLSAAETKENEKKEAFNAKEMIMHHVKDAHEFHIVEWNNEPISISLPIILWTNKGLTTFSSSEFHTMIQVIKS